MNFATKESEIVTEGNSNFDYEAAISVVDMFQAIHFKTPDGFVEELKKEYQFDEKEEYSPITIRRLEQIYENIKFLKKEDVDLLKKSVGMTFLGMIGTGGNALFQNIEKLKIVSYDEEDSLLNMENEKGELVVGIVEHKSFIAVRTLFQTVPIFYFEKV